jgi:hypothetical protein
MTRVITHIRSNVIAYLALFVALGGTSYAAVSIPNHSVTPSKLDSRYFGGYVRGWVSVSATGHVVAAGGTWNVSMDPNSPGHYGIIWRSQPKSRCTSIGSVDVSPGSDASPGSLTSTTFGSRHREFTLVYTYNSVGEQVPMPFDLAFICATPR